MNRFGMKMIRSSTIRFSTRFSTTCTLALAFVFLCAFTDSASAQNAQWRFVISSQTQWGNVTLSPGNYTFSINAPGPFARVVLQRNKPGVPATIMIASISCDEIKVSAGDSAKRRGNGRSRASFSEHGPRFPFFAGDSGNHLYGRGPAAGADRCRSRREQIIQSWRGEGSPAVQQPGRGPGSF